MAKAYTVFAPQSSITANENEGGPGGGVPSWYARDELRATKISLRQSKPKPVMRINDEA